MAVRTTDEPGGVPPDDLDTARASAWAERQRRRAGNEPCTDGVTVEALADHVEGLRLRSSRFRPAGKDYAVAVIGGGGTPSVDGSLGDEDSEARGELSWVAFLPQRDRRLFAEEMSHLMAAAAETDDLMPVERALREWRVTSEIFSDPELAQRFSKPLLAYGERVPRPPV